MATTAPVLRTQGMMVDTTETVDTTALTIMVGLIRIPRDSRATTTTETAIGFRGDADLENGKKKR